jgi:excinuclease ABC subunit C
VRLSIETYPRFSLVNKIADDSAWYFGPFGGRFETRQALDAVLSALRLSTCNRKFPKDIGVERPCLNFHMGRCDGFCRKEMSAEEYNRRISQAVQLLEGKSKQLLREMTAEMEAEAEELRFEQAAQIRDRIQAISALSKKQSVIAGLCADTDIWGIYRGAGKCCYAILHMEDGNLAGRETELFSAPMEETEEEMLSALTAQYYLPRAILPHEILLPIDTGDCENLSEALTKRAGHKVWVHVPQRVKRRICGLWHSATQRKRPNGLPRVKNVLLIHWKCWGRCWICRSHLNGWSPLIFPIPERAISWRPWWCTAEPVL